MITKILFLVAILLLAVLGVFVLILTELYQHKRQIDELHHEHENLANFSLKHIQEKQSDE